MRQLEPLVKVYDWGMPVEKSIAHLFISEQHLDQNEKIAELWWGHPHATIRGTLEKVQLPYLLKLLFVEKPLSLQAHPTQEQINKNPLFFPDPIQKPEVVIALTGFEVLCGFLNKEQIHERISGVPDLCRYYDFQSLFNIQDIGGVIGSVYKYAIMFPEKSYCRVFLLLLELHPHDPTVLCPFYMNYIHLKKGQGLVIPASQPHCYLSGQGVECMPPSDNIVRCGLTTKYCDRGLFFQISGASPQEVIIKDHPYDHPELNIFFRLFMPRHYCFCKQGSVIIVIDGEGTINNNKTRKGISWIVEKNEMLYFSSGLWVLIVDPNQ